jgi:hypothetical protein
VLTAGMIDDIVGVDCSIVIRGAVAAGVVDGGPEDVSKFEDRNILLIRVSRIKAIVDI